MRELEGWEIGILVVTAVCVMFLGEFWITKPFRPQQCLVVMHAEACQLVRYAGMPVKDAGPGLCAAWARFSAVSTNQVELEFATTIPKKTTVTIPYTQVAGYIQTADR